MLFRSDNPSGSHGHCAICLKLTRVSSTSVRAERELRRPFFVPATEVLGFDLCQCSPARFSRPFCQTFARYRAIASRRHNLPRHHAAARRSLPFRLRRIPSRSHRRQGYARCTESLFFSGAVRRESAWRKSMLFRTEARVASLCFACPINDDGISYNYSRQLRCLCERLCQPQRAASPICATSSDLTSQGINRFPFFWSQF